MASFLLLRFPGLGVEDYHAVNERLGIDVADGTGDWPAGLLSHVGGTADDGFVVAPAPSSVEWIDLEAYVTS